MDAVFSPGLSLFSANLTEPSSRAEPFRLLFLLMGTLGLGLEDVDTRPEFVPRRNSGHLSGTNRNVLDWADMWDSPLNGSKGQFFPEGWRVSKYPIIRECLI